MNKTLDKGKKLTDSLSMIVVGIIGLIFVILAVASMLQTSRIDHINPKEVILFDDDAAAANIGLVVISLLGFIALKRKNIHLSKVDTRFVVVVMLLVTSIISLTWVILVKSVATGEARILLDTAKGAAQEDYTRLTRGYGGQFSFYQYYPSQLGYVFFAEIIYRIFGAEASDLYFQIPNIIALCFAYVGIVMITNRILKNKTVTNMTAIALTVCLQPMFMSTYTSPMIIGLAFAVWSVYFTVRYMQDNKLRHAGIAALLITLSVVLRYNNIIMLTAICIALILHTIGTKRFLALAAAAVMAICSIGVQKLVIYSYGERGGIGLHSEITLPVSAYLGISESTMAPGWYNDNALITLRNSANTSEDHQPDNAIAEEAARERISERVTQLNAEDRLTEFYKKKFLSQFNEPYMESVWISQTRGHNLDVKNKEELSPLVISVYREGFAIMLDRWFPYYNMMIFFGFAAGMIWMMFRRRMSPDVIILPIAVLGGMIYHMIGEAKSLYFLPYFVLLIPFAMYGLFETTSALKNKTDLLFASKEQPAAPAHDQSSPNKPAKV